MNECDYGHETTGTFSSIHVPLADDDGFPVEPQPSPFEPAGLVLVMCDHGLAEHPAGREKYPRFGVTWVRAKYATTRYLCVIDDGAERPADLTELRA